MKLEEVKMKLCYYDDRNPNNVLDDVDDRKYKKDCACDNCFYGRTELAEQIIKLVAHSQDLRFLLDMTVSEKE